MVHEAHFYFFVGWFPWFFSEWGIVFEVFSVWAGRVLLELYTCLMWKPNISAQLTMLLGGHLAG